MVTQPTLSDVLIEAGFETSIAHRVADVIERDLAGVAQQPDVDRRFDNVDRRFDRIEVRLDVMQSRFEQIDGRFEQIDERFTTQDRLIDGRFEAVDKEFQALHQRIDDFKENNDREFKALHQRIADFKESIERIFAERKESVDRRISMLSWAVALAFALMIGGFGAIIALLISILERLP